MKRVCFITPSFTPPQIGGVATSASRIVAQLQGKGYEVEVLFPFGGSINTNIYTNLAYPITVWELPDIQEGKKSAIYNFFTMLSAWQRTRSYDLFHAFYIYPLAFPALQVARLAGIPIMGSVRGNDLLATSMNPTLLAWIIHILKEADWLTFVSTDLLRYADSLAQCSRRSSVIFNGIDPACSLPSVQRYAGINQIAMAGVLKNKKGVEIVISAIAKRPPAERHLTIVGFFKHDDYRQYVDNYAAQCGVRLTVTGPLQKDDFMCKLRQMSTIIFPSNPGEGCPNTFLEALALGKAIIVGRNGAMAEIIEDRRSGLIVDEMTPDALAQKIAWLDGDLARVTSLGKGAIEVANMLTPEREAGQYLNLYQQLVNSKCT